MNIDYVKREPYVLEHIEEKTKQFHSLQYYNPLYTDFFEFKNNNWKQVALNHEEHIETIENQDEENDAIFDITTQDGKKRKAFFKYSPLLDPLYYITGYYNNNQTALELPKYDCKHSVQKVDNIYNSAYIDNFFYYLADMVGKQYQFPHALNYYGSFIGIKKNFKFDISDDLDTLEESIYFHKNHGQSFKLVNEQYDIIFDSFTRKNREPLQITLQEHKENTENKEKHNMDVDEYPEVIHSLFDPTNSNLQSTCVSVDTIQSDTMEDVTNHLKMDDEEIHHVKNDSESESESDIDEQSCTSQSEHYSEDNEDSEFDMDDEDEGDEDEGEGDEFSDSEEEEDVFASINEFPTQMICLEKLYDTLDNHMEEKDISNTEWGSILVQVIMTLISYQKVFDFTHNDLHTNNVMYQKTKHKFILYKVNNLYYEIPSYGKIYKLIDYGRAIFRYKNKRYCSDSYEPLHGDASSQYNCEPFLNPEKPLLEPNRSFDMCRLSCSLYDYFIHTKDRDDLKTNPVYQMIREWCLDDKGRHILYKDEKDPDLKERFPGFKLYKSIAKLVNKHIPVDIIQHEYFEQFKINEKRYKKLKKRNVPFVDVDALEPMYSV